MAGLESSSIIGMINNAALLLGLGLLYDMIRLDLQDGQRLPRQVLVGFVLGVIGIAIMLNPWDFGQGVVFDTRSVLLCVAGFFFGPLPAAMAMMMTGAFRLSLGGTGAWTGVSVIVSSGLIGLVWGHLRRDRRYRISSGELYLMGLVVHAVMLGLMLTLPWAVALKVLAAISLPVMIIYPLATAILGKLMVNRWEHRQSTHDLRKSEEVFRHLFENHAAVKLLVDPETGRIIEANKAAEEFYGWPVDKLRSMNITEINALPLDQIKEKMVKARVESRTYFEFIHRIADGSVRDVEVYTSPVTVNGRDVLHSIIHDVTERKLLESQLLQAQKMESVGRLAGGVAHDYNNMLGVIIGYTELILEKLDSGSELREDMNEIFKAARRSTEITRQLLAFSRQQPIAPRPLDLNETVESLLRMLRRLIGEDIDLIWQPGPRLWPVYMDPIQVDQILVNLCVNARDAIDDVGRIIIETTTASFDAAYCAHHVEVLPGDYVVLSVTDDGCGMDSRTRENVFEPFYTTKGTGKGTGLGLATVYGIVKQNKGLINIYSEPGQGSIFRIYLPRNKEHEITDREKKQTVAVHPGNETLLLVEDDPSLLRMTSMMLERQGYHLLKASTIEEALTFVRDYDGDIQLMITDVIMPDMNGRELADQVKAIKPDVKVLFMSGYTASVIADRGILDDGLNFIQKPFTKQDLAVKVRETLDRT